jgi:proline iminopeptidase
MKALIVIWTLFLSATLFASERIITTSDGVDLYVKVKGTGPSLLYIHGGPGSGGYWFEKLFGNFMEQHFTVVYLDQRGTGRSKSAPNKDYSLERMILDFEEVRQELGYSHWFTFGHSFGGILQMGYAEKHPEAIDGMIMANCTLNLTESACESWLPKAAELVGETYSCTGDTLSLAQRLYEIGSKVRNKDLFWKMGTDNKNTLSKLDELSSEIPNFNYDLSNSALEYPEYWNNYKPITSTLKMPVLYFYGTKDYFVGPEHYKNINFPNLLLWKNEGGHIPFIEAQDDLEKAILAYISKYKIE